MEVKNGTSQGLQTIIGSGTSVEGKIIVSHDIRVDGNVTGTLIVEGDLTVGKNGVVEADIESKNAKIGGKVRGNLKANEGVELYENSSLIGDIITKNLVISEGAVYHGNCSMQMKK